MPSSCRLRFDKRVALISRSKFELSNVLGNSGINHIPRFRVRSLGACLERASACGYPAVLRSDTGYSGRGVWIAESASDLRRLWGTVREQRSRPEFLEMLSVLRVNTDRIIIEPLMAGEEWSMDCVIGRNGISVIRACEKVTTVFQGRPVTLAYRLVDSEDLLSELSRAAKVWCAALLSQGGVSFAQFDVRRSSRGDLVPLDFGLRLGGDQIPQLVRRASSNGNPYASALDWALSGGNGRAASCLRGGGANIHIFAKKSGTFRGISIDLSAEVLDIKPSGYRIECRGGVGVFQRVGTVFAQLDSRNELIHACDSFDDWAHVNYD